MKALAFLAAGLALVCVLWLVLAGCFPVDKTVRADVGYKAQQAACIDRNETKAAIDKCRDRVKAAWVTDAGADADAGQDGAQ